MRHAPCESVAVGFFDGVHIGHQAILRGATAAITFRNHPLSVLAADRAPRLIMSLEDRLSAIRACGIEHVEVLDFTDALAREPAEVFMNRLGTNVRCGENWRFGAGGVGNAQFLAERGRTVTVVPYAEYKGGRVSSTRIRNALETGEIDDANAMLGHFFSTRGTVFRGKGMGRVLGFPTVNLSLDMSMRLPRGVYAVELHRRRAIANYGVAPTMGNRAWNAPCLECHFIDDIPSEMTDGTMHVVSFLRFIRPERRFDSTDALVRQIETDITTFKGKP